MIRRIESAEEKENREKKRARIVGFVLLGIMILSTFGYAFFNNIGNEKPASNSEINNDLNGSIVQQSGDRWSINYGGQRILFFSSPNNVKNISNDFNITLGEYSNRPLYIASNNSGIREEISSSLGLFTSRVQEACYGQCDKNIPEKNCTDNLIIWKDSNENRVYQKEKCIFLEGDIRAADAFLYKILGVN